MSKKPKIIFAIDSLCLGGAERVLSELANDFSERGFPVTLLTFNQKHDPQFYPLNSNIFHRHLADETPGVSLSASSNYFNFLKASGNRILALRKIIREGDDEIVFISFLTHVNIVTAIAALGSKAKIFLCERTYPPFSSGIFGKILRSIFYLRANKIVVQTERGLGALSVHLRHRAIVIANPVRTQNHPLLYNKTSQIILGIGRFSKEKGFDRLIRIFANAKKTHPAIKLVLVGEGPEKQHLKKTIEELNLNDCATIDSPSINIFEYYKNAAVFCLTSYFEGFPNALAEAMNAGLPVISMDFLTGPSEMIDHNVNGILIPDGDENKFSQELIALMLDSSKRETLGISARKISQKYSQTQILKKWIDLVEEKS